MFRKITIIILILLSLINASGAAISGQAIVTNLTATNDTSRAIMGTNSTLNFSFTESAGNNYTNFTFPSTMKINEIIAADIVSNQASVVVAGKTNNMLNLTYTANSGGSIYFNFSGADNLNISLPATAGTYNISVMTNASRTAGVNISLYARDVTQPYFLKANNSVYTVQSESFGTATTTINLIGTGAANLTINAPFISGQTNATHGYGATNASVVRVVNATGSNVKIFIETDASVANPVVVISNVAEMQAKNLPAALAAAGGLTAVLIYVYKIRRRTR